MLSIEDTDKGSECGSLNASPVSKSLRDNKIKNTRLSMKVTLFGTPRSEKREFSDSPSENIKKYCGSWSTTNHYSKDQVGWDREEPHFRIEKSNDRKPTEETLTPNMEDEHKKISVGLYNDKPNEAYYGNIVSLDSISCSQGSQGSLPDEISMKTSQNRKLRLETNPAKDHTSPLYPEEDEEGIASRTEEDGNLAESPGQYIPPIFSKGIESEAEELREELQIEDGQNIYLIRGDFFSYYIEEETLGEGMSGIVKKCTKVGTEETFAVKMVRYRGDTELLYLIVSEFKNHKNLNHKNIIKVYELYIDYVTKRIYTVMELAECKEMFETIQDLGNYSEAVASEIFKQILSGINYLHLSGVCHRDLKPNNILVSNDAKIVKITDFNVSKFTEKEKKSKYSGLSTQNYKMWTHTGTIAFTAPEVFTDSEYTEAVDMWSAGVVLYTMLCGYQPFQGDNIQELIELIKEGKYEFHSDPWDNISAQAKELIKRLIDVNVKTRYSPFQALTHPWIANQGKVSNKCISGVIENLWSYLNKNSKQDGKQTSSKASVNADSKGSFSELPTPKLYDGANKFKSTPPKKQLLGAFLSPMRNKLTSNEEKRFFYQQGINYSDELGLEKSLSFGLVEGQANFFKLSQIQKEEMKRGDDFQIFKELKNAKAIPDLSQVCETIGEDNNEDLAENDNKEEEEPISCVRDSDDSF